jgi:hypothetical protein
VSERPISEVLPGIEIAPLEDGDMALSAMVLVKILDSSTNDTAWVLRRTNDLNDQELLGVLIMEADRVRAALQEGWQPDEDDE